MPGVANWVPVGPTAIPNGQALATGARVLVSGRITDIAVHPTNPSIIYIATARGGVWKTTDSGESWTPLTDNELSLADGAIALAPSAPDTIYVGTGEGNLEFYVKNYPLSSSPDNYLGAGVLMSTNGGATWTSQGLPEFTGAGFFRIAVHPTDPSIAFAATSNGLYRTLNGGTNWVRMTSGLPALSSTIIAACDVALDPGGNIAYAAFWADGIYRTSNATAASPTWTRLTSVLPTTSVRRIVIAIAPSMPDQVYALYTTGEAFLGLFVSTSGTNAATWTKVPVTVDIGQQSSYNLDLSVDPTTPDILYISALSVYKVTRSASAWSATDIGQRIHSDQHCLAFDPGNHLIIYAGGDGGIYKSIDGGATWSDSINRGMTITQFEFLDQNPFSDAVVFGGTQDNGTEAYRNSEIFYHADEGDGSFIAIDQVNPSNVLHGFFGGYMGRSTLGGEFGMANWDWDVGPHGTPCLFYPPFTLDASNPMNIAFGGNVIKIDDAQGTNGWATSVALPGISGRVSAVSWPTPNRIYAGTTSGQIYALTKSGTWTATLVSAPPLPARWVWDILSDATSIDVIYVALAGFGTPHVYRGSIAGVPTWTPISGTTTNALPDAPVFALAVRPGPPDTLYAGTDVGVYSSGDGGTMWSLFSSGLPNTAIYDLKYHAASDMLRAGTHGRGLWERQLNAPPSVSDVNIFLRDNVMDAGRRTPSASNVTAAFNDPLRHVALGDTVWWWESADIKIDVPEAPAPGQPPSYQLPVAEVNDLTFETALAHRNPQRGRLARVYAAVHNRGITTTNNVHVKLLRANAFGGVLPDLPADFWTTFMTSGDQTNWKVIGSVQTVTVLPGRTKILEWDWTPDASDIEHSSLLVVADCDDDPIPSANKSLHIWELVPNERHATQLNLRVVDAAPGVGPVVWTTVAVAGDGETRFALKVWPSIAKRVIALVPKQFQTVFGVARTAGVRQAALTATKKKELDEHLRGSVPDFEAAYFLNVAKPSAGAVLAGITPAKGKEMYVVVGIAGSTQQTRVTITQEAKGETRGGCTIVVRSNAS